MRVLELFAGAGGAALGLHAAGMESVGLVEWDHDACETLRAAGMAPVIEDDVRDLDAIEAQITGQPDVLWSSFPCQAWSQAGKRKGAQDERNGWPWTVAALDRFGTAWFLGENVRGLLSHRAECPGDPALCPGCYFHGVILPDLRARFACVGYWLLDAADYGVPQHRRRVILWAGPRPVDKPQATHGDPAAVGQCSMFGPPLKPWISMGQALGIHQSLCVYSGSHDKGRPPLAVRGSSPAVFCRGLQNNKPWDVAGAVYAMIDDEQRPGNVPRSPDQPFRAIGGGWNAMVRMHRPAPCVSATEIKGGTLANRTDGRPRINRASCALQAATGRRRLTVRECATLQDFPPDHPFQGTKTSQYQQIGNAVPPKLAEVVGRAVIDAWQR